MINTVRVELYKALHNRFLYVILIIGCAITVLNVVYFVPLYYDEAQAFAGFEAQSDVKYNTANDVATPFGRWIGMEGFSIGSSLLYFVFPLLVAIPYGWSYCLERNSGYEKSIVIRSGKTNYYLSKYLALFVVGGLAIMVPLVFNFLVLSLFLPLIFPNVSNCVYYGIFPFSLFSELFYSQPYLYVLSMCTLNFIFGGLVACLCYAVSLFVKNRVVVTLTPFALLVALRFGQQILLTYYPSLLHREFNPLFFLRGQLATTTLTVVVVEILVLLLFSLGLILARGKRREIY
jgi:hypothetical protein